MSEKRYFRLKNLEKIVVYAFPEKIKATIWGKNQIETFNFDLEHIENDDAMVEISEVGFLNVFNQVNSEITLRYHNQFTKENEFIKNEILKSEGY